MDIKRKDGKPMVIHTKEKAKIHVKGEPEAKIKGRNILTVSRAPKISGFCEKETRKENIPDQKNKGSKADR